MLQAVAERNNYSLIGKMLASFMPEVYLEIEELVRSGQQTDLRKIPDYFAAFQLLSAESGVESRRLFTATMLKLYHPYAIERGLINVKHGFVREIRHCFGCKQQSITRDIREVVVYYKAYEEFRQKVNELAKELKDRGV
ncbi:MAG: hypothetical protein J7527_01665 [Chitinophagaceae bacterium]|nr:hypothetical protein [Chitinophagaceae bacterium]